MGDAADRDGLWQRDDLLATIARLASGGYLGLAAPEVIGNTGSTPVPAIQVQANGAAHLHLPVLVPLVLERRQWRASTCSTCTGRQVQAEVSHGRRAHHSEAGAANHLNCNAGFLSKSCMIIVELCVHEKILGVILWMETKI